MFSDKLERWGVQELSATEEVAVEGGIISVGLFAAYLAIAYVAYDVYSGFEDTYVPCE